MALFGSAVERGTSRHRDDYSAVSDEEGKPLHEDRSSNSDLDHDREEMPSLHPEVYALNRSLRRINLYLKIVVGLLVVCLLAIVSINVPDSVKRIVKAAKCDDQFPLIKTPVPPLGRTQVIFDKHKIYSQRPNDVSDQAWNDLLPDGRGFVYIRDWEKYDLPPGQNTSFGMIYSTAVFHQMHCLGQIRRFSWMFLDAIANNDTAGQADIKSMFVDMDHSEHMNHCFDYLRQTIQCGGDMAMEWPRTEPDGTRIAVDGWGIPHECKDWSEIMQYMDKEHFDHSMVSDIAPIIPPTGNA